MRRTKTLKVIATVAISAMMFMATVSWVAGTPCPLMKPITNFTHQWWSAGPIDLVGAYVLWRFWSSKRA